MADDVGRARSVLLAGLREAERTAEAFRVAIAALDGPAVPVASRYSPVGDKSGRRLALARLIADGRPVSRAELLAAAGGHPGGLYRLMCHPWFAKLHHGAGWTLSESGRQAVADAAPPAEAAG